MAPLREGDLGGEGAPDGRRKIQREGKEKNMQEKETRHLCSSQLVKFASDSFANKSPK